MYSSRQSSGAIDQYVEPNPPGRVNPFLLTMVLFFVLSGHAAAAAGSLATALSQAYLDNPTLAAERVRQRATDEEEPQARSGWRPTIEASASAGHKWIKEASRKSTQSDPGVARILLTQPVFRGLRTINSIKRAQANIAAGRQDLLAVEQEVLLAAATAYMDVIRDREISRLRRGQVNILVQELRAARGRMKLGAGTKTDVAQAKSRLGAAIASEESAKADLEASVANYVRVIGQTPKFLKRPRVSPRMPKSLKAALSRAERLNPELLASLYNQTAADLSVEVTKGELLPKISLQAEYEVQNDPSVTLSSSEQAVVRGVFSVPLYQGGVVYSQIREAKLLANRRRLLTMAARRKVRNQITRQWSRFREAGQKIIANKIQVGSAIVALQGVRQEAALGNRTTLDILDAERELLFAREAFEMSRRDQVVRGYEVIAAMGAMTAHNLRLSVAAYDPAENYQNIRHRVIGTDIGSD